MKTPGAKFEFERERNLDLLRTYRKLIASVSHIDQALIYKQLVEHPSKRFWVSEERANIVVSSMMRGCSIDHMNPSKRAMFQEIYRRTLRMKQADPSRTIVDIVSQVVNQEAPHFYLTPGSARVILIRARRQCKDVKTK